MLKYPHFWWTYTSNITSKQTLNKTINQQGLISQDVSLVLKTDSVFIVELGPGSTLNRPMRGGPAYHIWRGLPSNLYTKLALQHLAQLTHYFLAHIALVMQHVCSNRQMETVFKNLFSSHQNMIHWLTPTCMVFPWIAQALHVCWLLQESLVIKQITHSLYAEQTNRVLC